MVDPCASLLRHFLDVPAAHRVCRTPADADQDDVDWETHVNESRCAGGFLLALGIDLIYCVSNVIIIEFLFNKQD